MTEITPTELAFTLIRRYCQETGVSIEIGNTNDYFQRAQVDDAEMFSTSSDIYKTKVTQDQQRLLMTPTGFIEQPSGKEFSEDTPLLNFIQLGYYPPYLLANLRLLIVSIELDYVLRANGIQAPVETTTGTKAFVQI
jgi:hypothetical protein